MDEQMRGSARVLNVDQWSARHTEFWHGTGDGRQQHLKLVPAALL